MIDYYKFVFYWILYIIINVFSLKVLIIYKPHTYKYNFILLYVILCGFSIFNNINADHYNYIRYLLDMKTYSFLTNIELVYHFVAEYLNYDILAFRIVIIGITYMLFYFILNKFCRDKKVALLFYIPIYWMSFSTTIRSCFSDVFFFYGLLSFVLTRNCKTFFLMILFIGGAIFSHKSSFLLLPCALLSFFPLNMSKKKYYLLIPIWIFIGYEIFSYILDSGYLDDNAYLFGEEIEDQNIKIIIMKNISEFFLLFIMILNVYINRFVVDKSGINAFLYRFLCLSLILYIVFWFVPISNYLHTRFILHLSIPNLILMSNLQYCSNSWRTGWYVKLAMCLLFIISNIGILRYLLDQEAMVKDLF